MESKVSDLVKRGHDKAAQLKSSGGAVSQLISDLATQLDVQLARSNALAAENAGLKKSEPAPFSKLMMEALDVYQAGADEVPELAMLSAYKKLRDGLKTPATDAFLAEVRAHDLNALISHYNGELDAHIKNGGEQFDEKSVRFRDIIVSARLFREQLRKGAQS